LEFVNYNQYVSKLKTMTPDKIKLDRYGSGWEMKWKDIKRKLTKEEIETAKTQVINWKEIKEVCKNFWVSNWYLYYHWIKKDLKNVK
jgi:virulence-associated protein VapD